MLAAHGRAAPVRHTPADHGLEQGAVYQMPGGRWAVLECVQGDALRLRYVDARRALVLDDARVQLSVRMAPRLRLAWRADDWAARRRVVREIERDILQAVQALLEADL
jgi:hypothetical protein